MDNFRRRLLSLQDVGSETYVDLGLPSRTLWAKGNLVKNDTEYAIGKETDWGTYVSWGNIDGYNEGEGYNFNSTKYNSTAGASLTGNILANDTAHDICRARLGAPWYLPTQEDFQELYNNTDSEWVSNYNGTGVAGRKFMKKSDHSVFVFFPASGNYNGTSLKNRGAYGRYRSSSFYSSSNAYSLNFSSSGANPNANTNRYLGFSVRPVQNSVGVFIYTGDKLITSSEWATSGKSLSDVIGIAVITEDHKFVIAPEDYSDKRISASLKPCQLLTPITSESAAKLRFEGANDTDIMYNFYNETSNNAIDAVHGYQRRGKMWYLPSCGEFWVAYNNKAAVNAALSACGATAIGTRYYYWTSTYYGPINSNSYRFWALNWNNGNIISSDVTQSFYVRPFCAL